jgi:Family of unknown function (DUF6493)
MSVDPEHVKAALRAGDIRQVRSLLRDTTEAERTACGELLHSFFVAFRDDSEVRPPKFPVRVGDYYGLTDEECVLLDRRSSQYNAALMAARAGLAEGQAAAHWITGVSPWDDDFDEFVNVIADRRPPWLAESIDRKLEPPIDRRYPDKVTWLIARRLVRLGAIARPAIPGYTTRMPGALYQEIWTQYPVGPHKPQRDRVCLLSYRPLDCLLADPGLLDDEVWRLFEVPGAARELAKCDGTWEEALVTLSGRGLLDRGRLLDACLDAFFRDFAEVGWYATFHDRMAPTLDEVAARAAKYLALLGTNSAHGVSVGQRACDRLLAPGRLPLADLLAASPPLLLFPNKDVAIRQVKLLGKIAREPSLRAQALATAAGAFGHARLDVQEAALDLIGKLGAPDGAEAAVIAQHAAYLAPALASKAAGLGLLPAPPEPAPATTVTSAQAALPEMPPAPAPPGAVPPLEDPAELIRLLTQLMEDAPDPLTVERATAGAVRLATVPQSERERLGSPLVKRAEDLTAGHVRHPHELSDGIARLALAWAGVPCPPPGWASVNRLLFTRIPAYRALEAQRLVQDGPAGTELLAEPSAADGSVHPDTLLARLATWRGALLFRYDMEVALLRLPPVDTSFWAAWERVHPASAEHARHAYQAGTAKLTLEPVIETAPDRQGRSRTSILVRITSDPPAAAGESRSWQLITDPPDPVLVYHFNSQTSPVVASWPLLCPRRPELGAALLLRPLSECLVPGPGHADAGVTAVTGLTRSSAPLGPVGHLGLLTALGSAEASVRIAAADVWIQAALTGRLDPDLTADALVNAVTGDAIKLTRLADGFRHASRQPASALMIARNVFASADRLVPAKPPGLHLLLELAAEIGATVALPQPPESIVAVAAGKGSTKLVVAARRLADR